MSNRISVIIDLSIIEDNIKKIKAVSDTEKFMAVIKADGYGLGAVAIATYLEDKVDYFGVATIDEGVELRRAGISTPILVLGYIPRDRFSDLIFYGIEATVYDYTQAKALATAGLGRIIDVHIAIDSGMNRLGFKLDEYDKLKAVFSFGNLNIKGIFTHFSSADTDWDFSFKQQKILDKIIASLYSDFKKITMVHSDNTAMATKRKNLYNMIRVGIGIYGYGDANLRNSIKIFAKIVQIKSVSKGESVGYDRAYIADRDMVIGVVSAGYADGYSLLFSNKGIVKVGDTLTNVIGKICMDYFMIDLSNITANVNDDVVLFGDGIGFEYLEKKIMISPYEFLCHLGKRSKRIYFV